MRRLCVFEDEKYCNLYPLTFLRPVFELKCGCTSLLDKILSNYKGAEVCFFVRDYLSPTFKKKFPTAPINDLSILGNSDLLLINGRWLVVDSAVEPDGREEIGLCDGDVVYARVSQKTAASCSADNIQTFLEQIKSKIKTRSVSADLISYPWDLINHNGKIIEQEFNSLGKSGIEGKFSSFSTVYGEQDLVWVAQSAEVQPFVVIDTTHGPVIIDEGATISPYSRIEGPSYIGRETYIYGANVREGTAIGPMCRIGGEVEESIIHGYTNKYHEGFLGHSYLAEWANLGALTTNSDLKNDYSQVQVYIKGALTDSNETKVGCYIGDHTKTSIGTFFNTGTVVGIMCNLVGSGGILPKFVPSFVWFLNNRFYKGYGFNAMLNTARAVMARRNRSLSDEDVELMRFIHTLTKEERQTALKKGRKTR